MATIDQALTLTPGLPVKLPFMFVRVPLILSPIVGLRCWVPIPLVRLVVAGPWAPVPRTPELLVARGPLPPWPWWPMPLGCVVVFLVVVVVPVIGFLEVDSVTRAFCCVFLPVKRDMRLGFAAVVVERVRAMASELCVERVGSCGVIGVVLGEGDLVVFLWN